MYLPAGGLGSSLIPRDENQFQQNGYEFGTNTGRQGTFDPGNQYHKQLAMQRLKALETQWGPRLDMKYSDDTGLASNDATGYSQMLNARTEAANIQRILGGQGPLGRDGHTSVRIGRQVEPIRPHPAGQPSAAVG